MTNFKPLHLLIFCLVFPLLVLAQTITITPLPLDEGLGVAQGFLNAINNKQWGLAVSLGIVALVWVFRWALARLADPELPATASDTWLIRFSRWIHEPFVSWLLPSLGAVAGTVAMALMKDQPLTLGLVLSALVTGLTANGVFNGTTKLKESHELAKEAAAVKVKSTADALAVIDKNAGK